MTAIEQSNVDESNGKTSCTFLSSFQKQHIMAKLVIILAVLALVGSAASFSMTMSSSTDRRSFVRTAGTAGAAALIQSSPANAVLADPTTEVDTSDFIESESGLKYKVLKEGTGAIPAQGQTVKAHYTGWLDGFDSIRKFDSSRDRGRPFTFAVGKGQVIRGWDETFSQMKIGERRQIILPARLAYGDRGAGGIIPGGATLYFDVELLGIL